MHEVVIHSLPKRSLKELIELYIRLFWYGFLYPRLKQNEKISLDNQLEIKTLHAKAERLTGELTVLKSDLEALPHIEGTISARTLKGRSYYRLRWYDDSGKRQEKHLSEKKSGNGVLSLLEAQELINNAEKARSLKKEIKWREQALNEIKNKLTVILGKPIDLTSNLSSQIVEIQLMGRENERAKLENNLLHGISTLVTGEPGIGKSFLVKSLLECSNYDTIVIDSLRAAKTTLIENVISVLYNDNKISIEDFIDSPEELKDLSFENIKKYLSKKTVSQLAELIGLGIQAGNYIIVIDSLTGLSQSNKVIVDKLIEAKATIIACCNRTKNSQDLESIYRKFDKLEIQPLSDKIMREIISKRLANIQADKNKNFLEVKILNAAAGNPGVADKMIQDAMAIASVSGSLTEHQIRNIQEPELSRKYFDLTPILIFAVAAFGIVRFIGHGMNDTFLYIFGGCAFVLSMAFSRVVMKTWSD